MNVEYLKRRDWQNWLSRQWERLFLKFLFDEAVDARALLAQFWAHLFPGGDWICKVRKELNPESMTVLGHRKSNLSYTQKELPVFPWKWKCLSLRVCLSFRPNATWLTMKVKVKVIQSCPTLRDPMDYTVHGIFQARILDWVAYPFSSTSSRPRNRTWVSCIAGGFFTNWAVREALIIHVSILV